MRIFLTNLGKYNEGRLIGEWVDLPVEDAFKAALKSIGINEQYEEYFISDYECEFKIGEYENIFELNEVAKTIEGMTVDEEKIFSYMVDNYCYTYQESLEIIKNHDYCFMENCDSYEKIGYYLIDNGLYEINPKSDLRYYIDYKKLGYNYSLDSNGDFIENGFLAIY